MYGISPINKASFAPLDTASADDIIWSIVTGIVVLYPKVVIPKESPTKITSTPAPSAINAWG